MELNVFIQNVIDILEDTHPSLISPETSFRELDEWDSLTALSLIAMADDEYSVKLTGDDIRDAVTFNDIFEKIKIKA